MRVFDLKQGETGVITKIELSGGARERLYSLGIREGEKIEVIRFGLPASTTFFFGIVLVFAVFRAIFGDSLVKIFKVSPRFSAQSICVFPPLPPRTK